MIDLKRLMDRVAGDSGNAREHFGRIGAALQAAALGDFRAELTTGQVRLLGELMDQLALEVVLAPDSSHQPSDASQMADEQRSTDGYGVQDWGQF